MRREQSRKTKKLNVTGTKKHASDELPPNSDSTGKFREGDDGDARREQINKPSNQIIYDPICMADKSMPQKTKAGDSERIKEKETLSGISLLTTAYHP